MTLAMCIKTGVDNPGHPHIKTVGLVAGDEECYETFKELFDPVIDVRHGGYGPSAKHPTDLEINRISNTDIDPSGRYVLTTRVRTGRSVRPFQLPPVISFEARRKLEAVAVKALLNMKALPRDNATLGPNGRSPGPQASRPAAGVAWCWAARPRRRCTC